MLDKHSAALLRNNCTYLPGSIFDLDLFSLAHPLSRRWRETPVRVVQWAKPQKVLRWMPAIPGMSSLHCWFQVRLCLALTKMPIVSILWKCNVRDFLLEMSLTWIWLSFVLFLFDCQISPSPVCVIFSLEHTFFVSLPEFTVVTSSLNITLLLLLCPLVEGGVSSSGEDWFTLKKFIKQSLSLFCK